MSPLMKVECFTCHRGFREVQHLYSTAERTLTCAPCRREATMLRWALTLLALAMLVGVGGLR